MYTGLRVHAIMDPYVEMSQSDLEGNCSIQLFSCIAVEFAVAGRQLDCVSSSMELSSGITIGLDGSRP